MIGGVPEEKERRGTSRYDAIIATFVGFLALYVSGYTAYMQCQQVRATVWPILQFDSSNAPDIHFTLANKGVGPAITRRRVDARHDKRDPSLRDSVGHYLPAVVSAPQITNELLYGRERS